jgi:methylmalonyl-CoA mutase
MTRPDLAEWRALAERELRESLETRLWETDEGFALPPLAAAETRRLPHVAAGVTALLARRGPWAVRARIDFAHPGEAAEGAARAVAQHGADELEVRLDVYARSGDEPEPQDAEDGVRAGELGLSAYCANDLEHVLDAIDLRRVPIAFDAGAAAPGVLAAVLHHAEEQGVGRSALRIELGLDPIGGGAPRNAPRRLDLAAGLLTFCRDRCPRIRPFVLDGTRFHDGSAVEELAGVMATAIALVRALGERGLDIEAIAAGTVLRLPVTTEPLLQIAKLRAARLLWAKIARAFGAAAPGSLRLPLVAVSSPRALAQRFDLRTNLVRTSVQAFAAALGGCDALVVAPWEPDPDHRIPGTLRLARAQQHILRDEARLGQVADPVAGADSIERLTHEIGHRAWDLLRAIEAEGGLPAPSAHALLDERIAQVRAARDERHRRRIDALVGVSRYVDPGLEEPRPLVVDRATLHDARCQALAAASEARNDGRVRAAVERLARANGDDWLAAAIEATAAGASFVQVGEALAGEPEVETEAVSADGDGEAHAAPAATFEMQRAAESAHARKVLLLRFGADDRADFAADLFRAGGFGVVASAPLASVDDALASLAQETPAAAVVCCPDAEQQRIVAALQRAGIAATLVVAGRAQDGVARQGVIFVAPGHDLLSALTAVSLRATLADPASPTGQRDALAAELRSLETLLARQAAR